MLGLGFLFSRLFIGSLRCKILLSAKSQEKISYSKVLGFNAIGSFFSVILPGSSAGDVVKFFYFRNLSQRLSATTVASIIALDRLIGILALLFIGTLVCILQWKSIQNLHPQLKYFVFINGFLCGSLGIFIFLFFTDFVPQKKFIKILSDYFSRWPKLLGVLTDMLSIKLTFWPFLQCFILSLLNQLMIFFSFWALASPFIPEKASFLHILTILPIGMIGAALPIAPAGLGVGHVLFDNLFRLLQIDNGASLFNLQFVAITLVNLIGIIPYVYMKDSFLKTQGE